MDVKSKKVKIGIFKRIRNSLMVFVARIQKSLFYEKTAVFTLTKLNEALVKELVEAHGVKEGIKKVYKAGEQLGHEFMMELSTHMVKDVKATPAYVIAAWETFTGHKPSSVEFKEIEIEGYKGYKTVFRDKNCPWCKNISFDTHFCVFPAGTYNGATATWAVITKTPLKMLVRETKCKAVGDEYCEWTFYTLPEDAPIEIIKKLHPDWFEIIDSGYFEF